MNNLPTELLSAIIERVDESDLRACTLVNKAFYTATVPILWRSYGETSRRWMDSSLKLLHHLEKPEQQQQQQHPIALYLRQLTISPHCDDSTFLRLLPHLRRLEKLTIDNRNNIGNIAFQQFPAHCPNLKTLTIHRMSLTQQTMEAIGQHCHQLEDLDLQYCGSTMTRPFALLVQHGCPLKKLTIRYLFFQQQWHQDMWMDVIHFTQLTYFVFNDDSADVVLSFVSLLSPTITTTTPLVWPHLTLLGIAFLADIGDYQLIPLIQARSRQLQHLSLQASNMMTDATLDAIATCLPALTGLQLDWNQCITATGLRRLVHRLPQLKQIDLYECPFLAADFPEAGEHYLEYFDATHHILHYLDQDALNKIRLAANPSGGSQQQA